MPTAHALRRVDYETKVDVTLAGSFPASDPPSWTLGASSWMHLEAPAARPIPAAVDVIVVGGRRFGGIRLGALGEAIAMAAMVPVAILIAGVPVVALAWGITSAIAWLTGNG